MKNCQKNICYFPAMKNFALSFKLIIWDIMKGWYIMKNSKSIRNLKKLIVVFVMALFSLPVMATCPIEGGACTAFSNWEAKPLQQKYVPNHIQEIQKPNAFQPSYVVPYHNELINTESGSTTKPPSSDYNSNCQFGVCLPGVEGSGSVLE
mgnify:FL=1